MAFGWDCFRRDPSGLTHVHIEANSPHGAVQEFGRRFGPGSVSVLGTPDERDRIWTKTFEIEENQMHLSLQALVLRVSDFTDPQSRREQTMSLAQLIDHRFDHHVDRVKREHDSILLWLNDNHGHSAVANLAGALDDLARLIQNHKEDIMAELLPQDETSEESPEIQEVCLFCSNIIGMTCACNEVAAIKSSAASEIFARARR